MQRGGEGRRESGRRKRKRERGTKRKRKKEREREIDRERSERRSHFCPPTLDKSGSVSRIPVFNLFMRSISTQ